MISTFLIKALDKGDVFIITNASPCWVEFSSEKYYPKIKEELNKVNIISTRGEFEKEFFQEILACGK